MDLFCCEEKNILLASAKIGTGIEEILEAIVTKIPPPQGDPNAPLRALIYDSIFDSYRGVIVNFRIFDGTLREGDKILFMATNMAYEVEECGIMYMKRYRTGEIKAGNVGYLTAAIRNLQDTKVGDTITNFRGGCATPIEGFKEFKPMVFSGIYPASADDFEALR